MKNGASSIGFIYLFISEEYTMKIQNTSDGSYSSSVLYTIVTVRVDSWKFGMRRGDKFSGTNASEIREACSQDLHGLVWNMRVFLAKVELELPGSFMDWIYH